MKYVVVMLLASLTSEMETKPQEFLVTPDVLASCHFSGEYPCLKMGDQPVTIVFRPGDEIRVEYTAENSRVRGMLVAVEDYESVPYTPDPKVSVCSKDSIGKTCFEAYDVSDVLVIAEKGVQLKPQITIIGQRTAVIVAKDNSPTLIFE